MSWDSFVPCKSDFKSKADQVGGVAGCVFVKVAGTFRVPSASSAKWQRYTEYARYHGCGSAALGPLTTDIDKELSMRVRSVARQTVGQDVERPHEMTKSTSRPTLWRA